MTKSRSIDQEVELKIRARVLDALAAGWTPELLWETKFWNIVDGKNRCGLAAVLHPKDHIGEITERYIEIQKPSGVVHRFYHPDRPQPWEGRKKEWIFQA